MSWLHAYTGGAGPGSKASPRLPLLLAVLLVLSWCVVGQDSFYFSPQPADVRVRRGESATLRCGVSNADRVAFHWTLDGEPVRNTTRRFQQGSDLRLTRVDPSLDMGEFRCIATNVSSGFSLASQGAQLNILSMLLLLLRVGSRNSLPETVVSSARAASPNSVTRAGLLPTAQMRPHRPAHTARPHCSSSHAHASVLPTWPSQTNTLHCWFQRETTNERQPNPRLLLYFTAVVSRSSFQATAMMPSSYKKDDDDDDFVRIYVEELRFLVRSRIHTGPQPFEWVIFECQQCLRSHRPPFGDRIPIDVALLCGIGSCQRSAYSDGISFCRLMRPADACAGVLYSLSNANGLLNGPQCCIEPRFSVNLAS
ncbi:hypothetical protein HPB50_026756 [Hyalomma asiaticum]|uniref:Uncharacterized protein n=1 Tax=Hyalomma asiaticum TaxID=266040 RepID=A0ACB7RXG9_HYAAI|nr:hypothetical protein HPB50_026756 [Hyalomma asiaticum]